MGHSARHSSKAIVAIAVTLAFSVAMVAPLSSFAADDQGAAGKAAIGEHPQIWKGQIASLQLSGTKVDWIMSGAWILRAPAGESLKDAKNASFLASITMVKPDGTEMHHHRISNLSISNATTSGGNALLQGTAAVTMKEEPVQGVPIRIEMNGAVIAIWVGPEKVGDHFGSGPIYGTLATRIAAMPPAPLGNAPANPAENALPAATQSKSTLTSSTNSTSAASSGTNSTQEANNPAPAASSSPQGSVIQMAAKDSVNLYSWFVGEQENPMITFAAGVDNTVSIQNPTDTKHHLVIESNGQQVASSGDVAPGSAGQLTYRPTSAGTLDYYCQYHSTMKGTIQVK